MMTEKLIPMQSMGNNKYSILYVMIVYPWLGNRNVKIGNMTTVQMAVSQRRWVLLSISYCVIKCLYQVSVITVFTVFQLLTDFVCLYNYEFWLSLCKIARSSVILLFYFVTIRSQYFDFSFGTSGNFSLGTGIEYWRLHCLWSIWQCLSLLIHY
jgi:hypothetical protein